MANLVSPGDRANLQLLHDVVPVRFHRAHADEQRCRHLGAGMPFGNQLQDLALPPGKPLGLIGDSLPLCPSHIIIDSPCPPAMG